MANTIIDFDIYGRKDANGMFYVTSNADAVANAMQAFLLARQGAYVNAPNVAGLLDRFDFKIMKTNYSTEINTIASTLNNRFSALARVNTVEITPIRELRITEISVTIFVYKTQEERNFKIYKKTEFNYVREINYIEVPFEKENLVTWINGELLDQPKAPIYFNEDFGMWVWNNFKFTNLTNASDELQYIVEMITNYNMNGSVSDISNI